MQASSSPDRIGFLAALAVAICASFHCAGMCGGFAVAASVGPTGLRTPRGLRVVAGGRALSAQVLFHAGKTTTYLFLGSMAGWFGAILTRAGTLPARMLSLLAGLFLVLVGASGLGLLSLPVNGRAAAPAARSLALREWTGWGAGLLSLRSPLKPLYLGVFSGFLPCPLVYAFLARAAASPSFLDALASMAALGLGTVPVLVAAGISGSALSPLLRSRLASFSGALMVLLGIWTFYRGWTVPACCAP